MSGSRDEQLVVFRLGEEHYGLDIATVQEIITWQPVTRVPRAPVFVEGLINLRGNVIPVVDLRKRFDFASADIGRETRIVVVEIENVVVGMVVDGVSEVLRVMAADIEQSDSITGVDAEFVRGVARAGERLIILLDVNGILERSEQKALASALPGAADTIEHSA